MSMIQGEVPSLRTCSCRGGMCDQADTYVSIAAKAIFPVTDSPYGSPFFMSSCKTTNISFCAPV